jgi:ABC-2 type transport system permease protein
MMLRNAVGNLSSTETVAGLLILGVSAVITLAVAVRIFKYGVLEYSRRLSLKTIFKK